jgi:hypothetical protein
MHAPTGAFGRRGGPKYGSAQPNDDHHDDADDEGVGRYCERTAGLAYATQVQRGQHRYEADVDWYAIEVEFRHGRDDVVDAGGDRDGDGHDVVDEQRCGNDQARRRAQVLRRHLIGTATGRIGAHDLAVRNHDDREQDHHREPHPRRQVQVRQAAESQDEQDLLRGVGD